jgi:hypothetical protein
MKNDHSSSGGKDSPAVKVVAAIFVTKKKAEAPQRKT